jgi:hypothetical protein
MNTIGPDGNAAISPAQALHLFGRFDVVVVLLRPAGIVEQDRAAEAIAGGELLQPLPGRSCRRSRG